MGRVSEQFSQSYKKTTRPIQLPMQVGLITKIIQEGDYRVGDVGSDVGNIPLSLIPLQALCDRLY